jgi:glycosyltransferase involved in cell wall biosynthesis
MANILIRSKGTLRNTLLYLLKTKRACKPTGGIRCAIVNVDTHISDDDLGRYTLIICQHFEHAGYQVIVKTNHHFFRRVNKYKRVLLRQPYSFVRNCSTPVNSIVAYNGSNHVKTIQLENGYHLARSKKHDCVASYPLHPDLYHSYPSPEMFNSLRSAFRVMRIFFSGNADTKSYNRDDLREHFKIMNRVEIINHVNEMFDHSGSLVIFERKEQLLELQKDKHPHRKIFINLDKTDSKDWLNTLSRSDFFLCAPGVRMPWAHNMVESMAMGTIPILQYANWCSPTLTHNQNCLAFKDAEDLQKIIQLALEMPQEEIERIRKNVIMYYEKHLSPASVVKRLETFMHSDKLKMTVAIPFIPSH